MGPGRDWSASIRRVDLALLRGVLRDIGLWSELGF